jgi:hypothetical protein
MAAMFTGLLGGCVLSKQGPAKAQQKMDSNREIPELSGYRNRAVVKHDFAMNERETFSHLRCQMSDNQFTKHTGLLLW